MKNCTECKKKTVGVVVKDPETGSPYHLPNLCSSCVLKLSQEANKDNKKEAKFKCKACKAKVWALRNGECMDCYAACCEAADKLPNYLEPLPPPLGYGLIGCTDIMAEMEVNIAYAGTPETGEKEC